MMSNIRFTILASVVSASYWLIESLVHKYVFMECNFDLISNDTNEMQMRIVIVIVFLFFGVFADRQLKILRDKEEEKRKIFCATVHSSQIIIDNLLKNVRAGLNEIYKTKKLDVKTTQFLQDSLVEAEKLEAKLVSISELNPETIKNTVQPA